MLLLRIGLYLAVAMAALATWLSWQAGYPMEVATVRGVVAFMAVSFVAYLARVRLQPATPGRHARRSR